MGAPNQRKMLRNENIVHLFLCGDKVFIEFVREKRNENRKERTRERSYEFHDRIGKSKWLEQSTYYEGENNNDAHENEADHQEISKNRPPPPLCLLQGIFECHAIAFSGHYRMSYREDRSQLAIDYENREGNEGHYEENCHGTTVRRRELIGHNFFGTRENDESED